MAGTEKKRKIEENGVSSKKPEEGVRTYHISNNYNSLNLSCIQNSRFI